MTTLPESPVEKAPADSIESQVYAIVDRYKEFMPITNDRYRLAFSLYKYLIGEGDEPYTAVRENKLTLEGITEKELAEKLSEDLKTVKK